MKNTTSITRWYRHTYAPHIPALPWKSLQKSAKQSGMMFACGNLLKIFLSAPPNHQIPRLQTHFRPIYARRTTPVDAAVFSSDIPLKLKSAKFKISWKKFTPKTPQTSGPFKKYVIPLPKVVFECMCAPEAHLRPWWYKRPRSALSRPYAYIPR